MSEYMAVDCSEKAQSHLRHCFLCGATFDRSVDGRDRLHRHIYMEHILQGKGQYPEYPAYCWCGFSFGLSTFDVHMWSLGLEDDAIENHFLEYALGGVVK